MKSNSLFHPLLSDLEGDSSQVIFRCISGSRSYGTHHEGSDTDIKGLFILPMEAYIRMEDPVGQISDERGDVVYYSLKRFLELAANANPNLLELLFMPDDCVLLQTRLMNTLQENRHLFVTKKAYESHVGYAQAQIKKARGRHKWVNNPQPKEPPEREAFCWIVPEQHSPAFPFRPIPLKDSGIDLSECGCASLEHVPDVYRLYHLRAEAKGVFRGGEPVCTSIPKDDEFRCVGLLIYNRRAYEQRINDHKNYWAWRKDRNDARWEMQERGEMDYDAKNMMHTFRLLHSGEHILRHKAPLVRFNNGELEFLKNVLAGKYEYSDLMKIAETKLDELQLLHATCDLPDEPDMNAINQLLLKLTFEWESCCA
ncbi:MAG: nucleotidyltransferase domain-containing protein [Pontiellaceae bacterium]|nr:nucleotidyltransferase domain-containing protein [Pontiellaceae bacterium]